MTSPTDAGSKAPDPTLDAVGGQRIYERETKIRNQYADRLAEYRPYEQLIRTEDHFFGTRLRGDMRTLDQDNTLRIWEFKLVASYTGLGQVLTYVALARRDLEFRRAVRGVLAAFQFQPEVELAIDVMNLGIEVVRLPEALRLAGDVPELDTPVIAPQIPEYFPPVPEEEHD